MIYDTSEWKEFKVGDLFTIERGKLDSTNNYDEGTTNVISCTLQNNGVTARCDVPAKWEKRITVTSDGQPCMAFYQEQPFNAITNVNVLIEKFENMNKYIACFICAMIRKKAYKYSYAYKCGKSRLQKETIKLPVTDSGDPDWEFMDQTMRNLWDKVKTNFSTENHAHQIDTSEWKEFRLGDLFDVKGGSGLDFGHTTPGDINFIGRTNINNGIQGKVSYTGTKIFDPNCITISQVGTMTALWQNEKFVTSQNISVIRNENCSKYSYLFICALINKYMNNGTFGYSRTVTRNDIINMPLRLPVTDSGEPDWEFMENMMKEVERHSLLIQHFRRNND